MPSTTRYREAASVHVDLPPDRTEQLLSRPDLLRALDDRFAGKNLEIQRDGTQVEVRDVEGHLRVRFRLRAEDEGTQVAATEDVRPDGAIEATKWMLMPGKTHEDFRDELDRLKILLEAVGDDAP